MKKEIPLAQLEEQNAEWCWDSIAEKELPACCYWEYARESDFLHAAHQVTDKWGKFFSDPRFSKNPPLPKGVLFDRDDSRLKSKFGDCVGELWPRIEKSMPAPMVAFHKNLVLWLEATPWVCPKCPTYCEVLRRETLVNMLQSNSFEDAPETLGVVTELSYQPLREPLAGELRLFVQRNVRVLAAGCDPLILAKNAFFDTAFPIEIRAPFSDSKREGVIMAAVCLDLGFKDGKLIEAFSNYLKLLRKKFPTSDYPPNAFPASAKGQDIKDWKRRLKRLGLFRLLSKYSWIELPEPIQTHFQKEYERYNKEKEQLLETFRKLFPFLPPRCFGKFNFG